MIMTRSWIHKVWLCILRKMMEQRLRNSPNLVWEDGTQWETGLADRWKPETSRGCSLLYPRVSSGDKRLRENAGGPLSEWNIQQESRIAIGTSSEQCTEGQASEPYIQSPRHWHNSVPKGEFSERGEQIHGEIGIWSRCQGWSPDYGSKGNPWGITVVHRESLQNTHLLDAWWSHAISPGSPCPLLIIKMVNVLDVRIKGAPWPKILSRWQLLMRRENPPVKL